MCNTYLVHHGIKGQKWGVRRYQNNDGSLTPEGRTRYNTGSENGAHKKSKLKTAAKIAGAAAVAGVVGYGLYKSGGLNTVKNGVDVARSSAKRMKTRNSPHSMFKDLSDEEIQARIGRLQSEIKLAELTRSANVSSGRQYMIDVGKKSMDKASVALLSGTAYAVGKHYMEEYLGYSIPRVDKK